MRRPLIFALALLTACGGMLVKDSSSVVATDTSSTSSTTTIQGAVTTSTFEPATSTTTLPRGVTAPPAWLGTRSLLVDDNGVPVPQATPPELIDRRFTTTDLLPPPVDPNFHATIDVLTPEVAARSTWVAECPVTLDQLRYLTVTFWGFDQMPHTGEMIVSESVAEDVVLVFEKLFETRFPVEQMSITTIAQLSAPPTGDGNNTESFVCRPVTGGSVWSQHAYGLAIDIDPFQNPYIKGNVVLPELASAYADRSRGLPGMITEGDPVTEAFDAIGWGWGGRWNSLKDYQHFSLTGT